jgi:site-specific recombinase XerC
VSTRRRELKRFLSWLVESGGNPDLISQLTKVRLPRYRTVIAKPEEIDKLVKIAAPWLRCWLTITAGHGLRFAEANRLSPAQYNRQESTITFRTKGEGTNTLPVSDDLKYFFQTAPENPDPNIPLLELHAGRRLSEEYLRKCWHDLKIQAGVNPELRPHDLRRTLAVRTYDLTKDLRAVQHLLGHANLYTTCGYLEHHDPDSIRPVLNQLRPRATKSVGFQPGEKLQN